MQVTVEDISTVKKVLHIEIPAEKITSELNAAYNTLRKTAKIKGFRQGKAPRSVLERLYKKDVQADVSSRLIQDSFIDAIKEKDIAPIGTPEIDPPALDPGTSYRYDATVEIKPTLGPIEFKGLELKKTVYQITDDMVDAQLKRLQTSLAQKTPIEDERPVGDDDFVLIDYEGFQDGKPFEETGKTENYTLKIGAGTIHEAFDNALKGMNRDETKEFPVAFPEDYHNAKLAGQTITFEVIVKDILVEKLPDIDEEFVKKLGKFESLDDLKKSIRENLAQGYEKRTEQELNEQAFSDLIEKISFEVPDVLVKFELDSIIAEAERSFSYHNMSFEDAGISKESLTEKYRDTAEKQARRHLILTGIVEQESMSLSDEELDDGLREMAEAYQQPFEGFKNYFMSQQDKLAYFKETLLEKKAMKLVLEHATINEVEAEEEPEEENSAE
jgi:trigger factor